MYTVILKVVIVFLGILCFLGERSTAQPVSYSNSLYNSQNVGLSHNTVTSLTLDRNGFLWVGTIDGVNRFDGKRVKVYRHDASDSTTISDNFIHGILEDDNGILWIWTRDGGINKFNPVMEEFTRYQYSELDSVSIPSAPVYMFYQDYNGVYWASVGNEAFGIFDPANGSYRKAIIKDMVTGKQLYSPNAVVEFMDESLLGVSYTGLYYVSAEEIQHFKKDLLKKEIVAERIRVLNGSNIENLSRIMVNDLNQIWVVSQNSGILKVKGEVLSEKIKTSLESGIATEPNQELFIEKEKLLIGATGEKDVTIIDKQSGETDAYRIKVGRKDFTPSMLYEDMEGGLWAASWGSGFIRLKEQTANELINPEKYPEMGVAFMLAFEEEPEKGLWFGGSDGLHFWQQENQAIHNYKALEQFSGKQIWSLERDERGLWVITVSNGMFFVPINEEGEPQGKIKAFTPSNSFLHSFYLHQVFIDSRGWMWIGYEGDGVQLIKNTELLLKGEPVKVRHYSPDSGGGLTIGGSKIRRMYEDTNGDVWLATMENGFTRIDIEQNQVKGSMVLRHSQDNPNTISFNDGRSIYQQNDSTYWFATYGGGINRWNMNTNTFLRLGAEQGLANNSTYGILPDEDGIHLWISTNNGLSRLNTRSLQFNTYTEEDGIQNNEFNTGAFLKKDDGKLVFGGIHGFNIIDTDKLFIQEKGPIVKLTEIKLFNEAYDSDTSSVYKKHLVLPHHQNFLSFEFAALDYEAPSENVYAYKMDGIDEEWVESGNRNFADYPNLKPGNYTFRVKAANSDGVWNEGGIKLGVLITPPWWQTWWFRSIAGLFILIGFVSGVRYISQRRLREQLRKMEVENKLRSERERISRDLHDHVGAQLANIKTGLTLVEKYNEKKNLARSAELMNSLRDDANITIKQLRETIWALNQNNLAIDEFIEYLRTYFQSQSGLREKLQIHYHKKTETTVSLSSPQALNIFRIIQEATQNTLKHAGAENLEFRFEQQNGCLAVIIKDDGQFKKDKSMVLNGGYGLGNIRKRAEELDADLQIMTKKGTEIRVILSL